MAWAKSLLLAGVAVCAAGPAWAQLAVSANDGKAVLVDGVNKVPQQPRADTVAIIDLSTSPPRLVVELEVPTSVVGPPMSVAVAPDESFALVTSSTKIDPADPTKTAPNDKVSVIDLKASPPKLAKTLKSGKGAAGVSINRAGTLALVANRAEGTVSVFTIKDGALTPANKITLGDEKSGPSQPIFSRDGRLALVSRDGDHRISVLTVDGDKVEYAKDEIYAGLKPYGMDIAGNGEVAVVANIGMGEGDADTITLLDLKAKPPRAVNTVTVGQTPEGIKMSPDGLHVAVTVMNGTNKPQSSPFYNDSGLVKVYEIAGHELLAVAEASVGHWCQGAAWSKDGKSLLVQCMSENEALVFGFDGKTLAKAGSIKMSASPAGIRTAEP